MTATQVAHVQAETYQAADLRLNDTAIFGPPNAGSTLVRAGGVVPGYAGNLAITQTGSPSMAVLVASGGALVPGGSASTGNYRFVNDASVTRTIAASTAQARIDIVVARVYDTGTAGSSYGDIEIITGTPGAGVPAIPGGAHAFKIAEVAVGANVTSITNANITDRRVWAVGVGGCIPCTSATRPANPYDGCMAWEADTNQVIVWSALSAGWRAITTGTAAAWTNYTPVITGSGANPTMGASVLAGRYAKDGRTVNFAVSITIGAGFAAGSGFYSISLPFTAASVTGLTWSCPAYYFDASPGTEAIKHYVGTGTIGSGASTIGRTRLTSCVAGGPDGGGWGNATPVIPAVGDELDISGTYESAT